MDVRDIVDLSINGSHIPCTYIELSNVDSIRAKYSAMLRATTT